MTSFSLAQNECTPWPATHIAIVCDLDNTLIHYAYAYDVFSSNESDTFGFPQVFLI